MTASDPINLVETGPDTLGGRFLRRFWHPVYRAEDLAPGTAVPIRHLSEEFTLYRGETSRPHLVASRCAHRGTELSAGWVEGDCIRCFYHGWKYDGSGQCVEQPVEDAAFAQKVRIGGYPTEEYLGLIFVYVGEGPPPALPRYPELEGDGVLEVLTNVWPCNYFQAVENSVDQSHFAFVHRDSSFSTAGLGAVPQLSYTESEYGITTRTTRPNGVTRLSHFHMPGINQFKLPLDAPDVGWSDTVVFKVPVDDDHVARYLVNLAALEGDPARAFQASGPARQAAVASVPELGEAVRARKLRFEDIDVPASIVIQVQDYVAILGQGRITNRERSRLGRGDVGVILLHQIWTRELKALAEGRPLKQWSRPPELVVAAGV
jgi:5,5'-dehydrodivanillate O-demethylase